MPTASTSIITSILQTARSMGVDSSSVLDELALSEAYLKEAHARIDCEQAFRFMERVQEKCRDPLFGLHFGRHFQMVSIGTLGYLVLSSASAQEGLDAFCRYQRTIGEGLQLRASIDNQLVSLTLEEHSDLRYAPGRHTVEGHFAALLTSLKMMVGPEIAPESVRFKHNNPGYQQEYADFFGCPVYFDQFAHQMVFPQNGLQRPLYQADSMMYQWAEKRLQQVIVELGQPLGTSRQVSETILQQLHAGRPTINTVAAALGLKPRTLQRYLADEGKTFQRLLDETRQRLAMEALTGDTMSIEDIAFWLGFSDASAFRKTFRRWTGRAPSVYRGQ